MKRRDFLGLLGASLVSAPNLSFGQTPTPKPPLVRPLRIVVIANTYYEGDGLMDVLCNRWARNQKLSVPVDMAWPRPIPDVSLKEPVPVNSVPRCRVGVQADNANAIVEIWCLDDLMDKAINHGASDNKATAITNSIVPYVHRGEAFVPPDGLVAFGTAAFPDTISYNGCATVGGGIYVRDARNDATGAHSNWTWDGFGKLIPSKTPASFFSKVMADTQTVTTINSDMLRVAENPAVQPRLIIASDGVAVSSVNIPRDATYAVVDQKTVDEAKTKGATNVTSVETTHGVIRAQWPLETPFIYVTAIPNRIGHFPDEAQGNYPQEFASVHNAAIVLNNVMPYFVAVLGGV